VYIHNSRKSAEKHDVSQAEAESIFFNDPLIVADEKHSGTERCFNALGKTAQNRLLHAQAERNHDSGHIGTRRA
jgi:uncharacterized protein